MSKFVGIFILAAFFVSIQGRAARRDVSELLRNHVPGDVIYGNGIEGKDAEIEHQHFQIDPVGNYDFAYKQTDLQERQESGEVAIDPETGDNELDNVVGSYKYVRPDGFWQIVEYRADKNGFVPKITVVKYENNEVSNDPPSFLELIPSFPIGSTTESSSGGESTQAAIKK